MTPSSLYEQGRLTGARSAVLLAVSIYLGSLGARGFLGASPTWMVLRGLGLSISMATVGALLGLWVLAGIGALLSVVLYIYRVLAVRSQRG